MYTDSIATQLDNLRPGDRITYNNVTWYIKNYSTYEDEEGYQTDEWLLVSSGGAEYYLLREYEADEEENPITWYISNELENVQLYIPGFQEDILPRLWQDMQAFSEPYPKLKLFYKIYYFDFQTQGTYDVNGIKKERITWDYWDQAHLTNLAIEAFPNRKLEIYSSKVVQPEEFSGIQKSAVSTFNYPQNNFTKNLGESIAASLFVLFGLLLMLFG
ncbi:MAG: DUF4178 domain-containing protein [Sphaerospermopsis sp. SIO1G2]|nr:DUF4178 domain-containing protein [Sphaerospermopsis sp. SIO1G2]